MLFSYKRINKRLLREISLITLTLTFSLSIIACSSKVKENNDSSIENDSSYEEYAESKATLVKSEEYTGGFYKYKIEEYNLNSSDSVYWNIIVMKGDKEIQKITQSLDKNAVSKPDISELVVEEDIDFDGKNDLLIFQGRFGVQGIASYKCYLNNENGTSGEAFKIIDEFKDIPNPSFDHNKKLIQSCNRENASSYVYSIYKITNTNNVHHIVKEATLKITHKDNGLSDCVEFKLQDGKMQIVNEKNDINVQEVYSNDGYFNIGSINWQSINKGENKTCD